MLHVAAFLLWLSKCWPYLVLATNIPDGEADVLVLHSLHIESCRAKQRSIRMHHELQFNLTAPQVTGPSTRVCGLLSHAAMRTYRWLGWWSQLPRVSACTVQWFCQQSQAPPAWNMRHTRMPNGERLTIKKEITADGKSRERSSKHVRAGGSPSVSAGLLCHTRSGQGAS
jgi:hypothetical protein